MIVILVRNMWANSDQSLLDVTMITCILASHPSDKLPGSRPKWTIAALAISALRVNSLLLLIIIPRLAKRRKIHLQPPCNLGDQRRKILAQETQITNVLRRKLYSKFLDNCCDDAVQLQDNNPIKLVLGWAHAPGS